MGEKAGCRVDGVKNGQKDPIDVILMDIRMPVVDGVEATNQIRMLEDEQLNKIPIIAVTENVYEEDIQNYIKIGMDAHIAKPISPEELYNCKIRFYQPKNKTEKVLKKIEII